MPLDDYIIQSETIIDEKKKQEPAPSLQNEAEEVTTAHDAEVLTRRFNHLEPPQLPEFPEEAKIKYVSNIFPCTKQAHMHSRLSDIDKSMQTGRYKLTNIKRCIDIPLDASYRNSRYECLRPTPLKPRHNQKLVFLLRLFEKSRYFTMEDKNSLSYRHAISAIKVNVTQHDIIYMYLSIHPHA